LIDDNDSSRSYRLKATPMEIRTSINAVAESFFGSLKKEKIRRQIYRTRELAKAEVFDYIEGFYNRTLRHSHLGGVSPEVFELASEHGR